MNNRYMISIDVKPRNIHASKKNLAAYNRNDTFKIPEKGNNIDAPKNKKLGVYNMSVKRGEIYYADLSPVVGSEQGGVRPVLIVQNDVGNRHSPTVIAAAITSQHDKSKLPTHIEVSANKCGLAKDSIVLLEQIRTIDKKRLKDRMGELDYTAMNKVDTALSISFGLEV